MKGQILLWTSIGFLIMSIIFLLPHLYPGLIANQYPGSASVTLFKTHYDAQEKLLFVDQAGQYALHDALRNLARYGGFASTPRCGEHEYPLWSSTSLRSVPKEFDDGAIYLPKPDTGLYLCYPDENKNFEALYPTGFGHYLSQTLYPYPLDNYNYEYTFEPQIQILAKAKNNLITQSEFNGQHFADYLVKPSYHVSYPHSLNVYEKIKQWTQETLTHCYDNPPACLQEAIQKHNSAEDLTQPDAFTLSTDCPETFDNLVEKYQDCAWTRQTDCLCSIPIDPTQKLNIEFKSAQVTILQPYHQEYSVQIPVAFGSYAGNPEAANRYTLELNGEKTTLTAFQDAVEIKKIENYPALLLYKAKEGLTVLQDPHYATGEEVPRCTLNKTRSKLCATTNHELPHLKPGNVEWKKTAIQFALELADRTPAFPDYSAKDKPSALPPDGGLTLPTRDEPSDGILVHWDKTPYEDGKEDQDIDHYLLYCSQGDFSPKKAERIPTYAFVFDDRQKIDYYTGEKTISINVFKKIASFGPYEITLQVCGGEEIHDDPKVTDSLYQAYVTAVDKNGNELSELPIPSEACPRSYYLEHPPTLDPTGTLTTEYEAYLFTIRQECWPKT